MARNPTDKETYTMADSILAPEELLCKLMGGQETDFLREALLAMLREIIDLFRA